MAEQPISQEHKSSWERFKERPFMMRMLKWEHWTGGFFYVPVFFMFLYFSIRSRAINFFSAANPGMTLGGLVQTPKFDVLKRFPKRMIPKTIFVTKGNSKVDFIEKEMQAQGISYPVIAKPNVGERGFLVEKINSKDELVDYLTQNKVDFLVQEFVVFPKEIGVLYHRFPDAQSGKITSIVLKEPLSVTGDGHSTIHQLVEADPRSRLHLPRLLEKKKVDLNYVPANGENVILEHIGNHCRGATFFNGNHLIDQELTVMFDQISLQTEGLYYGRYDIKYNSIEDLKRGDNFKIIELNGVNSEPAHIYHPGYPLMRAYRDFYSHIKIIYFISLKQRELGIEVPPFKETVKRIYEHLTYKKQAAKAS